jgi:hypothetical protein
MKKSKGTGKRRSRVMRPPERLKRARLLKLIGQRALQAQQEADRTQATLAAMAKAVLSYPGLTPAPIGDPGDLDFSIANWYYDQLQQTLAEGTANFDAACREILEGAAEAARRGDMLGAARAYQNYIRCLRRPRPLALVG